MKQHTKLSDFAHTDLPERLHTQETQITAIPQFRMPIPQQETSHVEVEAIQKQQGEEEGLKQPDELQKPALLPIQQKLRSTSYGGMAQVELEGVPQGEQIRSTHEHKSAWPIDPSTPDNKKLPNATTIADSLVEGRTLWDIRFFVTPFKRQIALIALLIAGGGLSLLVIPFFVSQALDAAIQVKSTVTILQLCMLFFFVLALSTTTQMISLHRVGRLGDRVNLLLVEQCYKHMLAMPFIRYQHLTKNGLLMTRIQAIVQGQEKVVQTIFTGIFFCVLLFVYMLALIVTDWRIGLLAIGMTPIIFIAEGYEYQRMQKVQQELSDEQEGMYAFLCSSIQQLPMIKAMLAMQTSLQQMRRYVTFASRARTHESNRQTGIQFVFSLVLIGLEITLLSIGGYLVVTEKLGSGHLFSCLILLIQVKVLLSRCVRFQQHLPEAEVTARELWQILQFPQDDNSMGGVNPQPFRGAIQLKHVHFANESGEEVLHDITIDIPAECTVAIIGAGTEDKRALLYLLMSLYQPKSGTIRVDNHDIQEFSYEILRQHYGLLLAQAPLFNGTIEENITMGLKRAIPIEEIEEAAHYANILAFIRKQPQLFKSELWQQGQELSEGERQRLAIARLLLLQPRVLLIEEDTRDIDPLTQQALKRIKHRRTTVIIAHHLSTLQKADQVVLLDHGRVIAQGKHDELYAQYGEYWNEISAARKAG